MKKINKESRLALILNREKDQAYKHTEMKMLLAAKIADTLKSQGYTQKSFAEKLGRNASEVSKWLSGNHNFTVDTLLDIQSLLEVELLNCKDNMKRVLHQEIEECCV